jgi:hypothetical protein
MEAPTALRESSAAPPSASRTSSQPASCASGARLTVPASLPSGVRRAVPAQAAEILLGQHAQQPVLGQPGGARGHFQRRTGSHGALRGAGEFRRVQPGLHHVHRLTSLAAAATRDRR